MELTDFKVKALIYPHGEYRLGTPVDIVDEGNFYRIDGTHIFDKHKIKGVGCVADRVKVEMTDKTVVLVVEGGR